MAKLMTYGSAFKTVVFFPLEQSSMLTASVSRHFKLQASAIAHELGQPPGSRELGLHHRPPKKRRHRNNGHSSTDVSSSKKVVQYTNVLRGYHSPAFLVVLSFILLVFSLFQNQGKKHNQGPSPRVGQTNSSKTTSETYCPCQVYFFERVIPPWMMNNPGREMRRWQHMVEKMTVQRPVWERIYLFESLGFLVSKTENPLK